MNGHRRLLRMRLVSRQCGFQILGSDRHRLERPSAPMWKGQEDHRRNPTISQKRDSLDGFLISLDRVDAGGLNTVHSAQAERMSKGQRLTSSAQGHRVVLDAPPGCNVGPGGA